MAVFNPKWHRPFIAGPLKKVAEEKTDEQLIMEQSCLLAFREMLELEQAIISVLANKQFNTIPEGNAWRMLAEVQVMVGKVRKQKNRALNQSYESQPGTNHGKGISEKGENGQPGGTFTPAGKGQ